MAPSEIRVACRLAVSPERVFGAWLDPRIAARWLFATASRPLAQAAIDARVAGSFRLVDREEGEAVEYTGTYEEIVRPRRLVFTLHAGRHLPVGTRVIVEIAPGTRHSSVTLIHENLPAEEANRMERRWTGMLYGLAVTLAATDRARGRRAATALFRKGPMRRPVGGGRAMSKWQPREKPWHAS